jgi:NAD(P)-dependent dehydrogenase (short-subunit alcohol dehydrogenase family)
MVTGGASGLGLAIARDLMREGATVAIVDIDGACAEREAQALRAAGGRSLGVGADVSKCGELSDAKKQIEDALGPIEGLVNNAGVAVLGAVHDTDDGLWRRVMDVNLDGVFYACRAILPSMQARGRGAIVNIASIAGLVGVPNMAAYCASKGAIIALSRQMAIDYARSGIRVNAIAPGTIGSTRMGAALLGSDLTPEAQARRLAKYPLGRYAEAGEISKAAVFLLSDDASFITGTVLTVDGGMTAY